MINELLLTDCMDYMKTCSDNQFDLAIVDPPYGIDSARGTVANIKSAKWRHAKDTRDYKPKQWDNKPPTKEYFTELLRVSQNQIIWGGNYFIEYLTATKGIIVWDKKNGNSMFADGELAWTSFNVKLRIFRYLMNGFQQEKPENRIHPTQKPVTLYKWLLTNYAKPNDKLLDTHSGSGSFRIAAYDLGFDLVSCELDSDYYRDNNARYQNHIKQGELFSSEVIQKHVYAQVEL